MIGKPFLIAAFALLLFGSTQASIAQAPSPSNQWAGILTQALTDKPEKAPPGELCLVAPPKDCGQAAVIIWKPYTGEGSLYYLEKGPDLGKDPAVVSPQESAPH